MASRFPWGEGRAPALDCSQCHRQMGLRAPHLIIGKRLVICVKCADARGSHSRYFPECADQWHDLRDHPLDYATRAGAWCVLSGVI